MVHAFCRAIAGGIALAAGTRFPGVGALAIVVHGTIANVAALAWSHAPEHAPEAVASALPAGGVWSPSQPTKVLNTPWQSWPLWKQMLLVLVVAGVAWVMYKAVKQLWESGERTLVAFAGLLGALIKTLPMV